MAEISVDLEIGKCDGPEGATLPTTQTFLRETIAYLEGDKLITKRRLECTAENYCPRCPFGKPQALIEFETKSLI